MKYLLLWHSYNGGAAPNGARVYEEKQRPEFIAKIIFLKMQHVSYHAYKRKNDLWEQIKEGEESL